MTGSSEFRYYTFAGRTMNELVARRSGVVEFQAGEIVLRSAQPIDFSSLPDDPSALVSVATQCLHVPDRLTMFQQLLPAELLRAELSEDWLKTPVYGRGLRRLS